MKPRIIEKFDNSFLIERFFRDSHLVDYITCSNYDRNTNTYDQGIITLNLVEAYDNFNLLINDYDLYYSKYKSIYDKEKKKFVKSKVSKDE